MIVYHGTTRRRALRICEAGFLPRKPSRRVWFAQTYDYAMGRARTQAKRSHGRPVVLTCDVDLSELRRRMGKKRVFHKNNVIAIDAPMPASVVRSHPAVDSPSTPKDLATWVNVLLGRKPHRGVGTNHPGIVRLSRWATNRLKTHADRRIDPGQLLGLARQWLPEYFDGVKVDLQRFRAYRRAQQVEPAAEPLPLVDPLEIEALDCLESDRPARRARGR